MFVKKIENSRKVELHSSTLYYLEVVVYHYHGLTHIVLQLIFEDLIFGFFLNKNLYASILYIITYEVFLQIHIKRWTTWVHKYLNSYCIIV